MRPTLPIRQRQGEAIAPPTRYPTILVLMPFRQAATSLNTTATVTGRYAHFLRALVGGDRPIDLWDAGKPLQRDDLGSANIFHPRLRHLHRASGCGRQTGARDA